MAEQVGIVLTWQSIVTIVSGVTAIILFIDKFFGKYNQIYDMINHQKEQDDQIKSLQEEQTVILKGVLACLKGLSEQGCDGPVHDATKDIEAYLISKTKPKN